MRFLGETQRFGLKRRVSGFFELGVVKPPTFDHNGKFRDAERHQDHLGIAMVEGIVCRKVWE